VQCLDVGDLHLLGAAAEEQVGHNHHVRHWHHRVCKHPHPRVSARRVRRGALRAGRGGTGVGKG